MVFFLCYTKYNTGGIKMAIKQPYIVIEQRPGYSKIAGTPMTTLTLIGIKDRREYVTYVDTPNRNAEHWQHITRNPTHGFVLRNLDITNKTTKKGQPIVNADSEILIEVEELSLDPILNTVNEFWDEEDRKRDSDRFGDLFE
jgi:hypothetical protein